MLNTLLLFSFIVNLAAKSFIVVIDPGHGGVENGATVGEFYESHLVLDIAKRIERELSSKEVSVVLTRDIDEQLSLKERADVANNLNADLFISIHANASTSSTLFGIETYSIDVATDSFSKMVASRENNGVDLIDTHLPNISPSTMLLSLEFAELVQNTAVSHLRLIYGETSIEDLGSKTALFSVLVKTEMPAILFEVGFMTNPSEFSQIKSSHYRNELSVALTKAVLEWIDRNQ